MEETAGQNVTPDSTTTLLIGLGRGGSALLPYLVANPEFHLVAVCDSSHEAVGMLMARMSGLAFYDDPVEAIKACKPQLVIDATGDPSLPGILYDLRPVGTSVVTGDASRLLWDLLSALEGRRRSDLRYDRLMRDMNSGVVLVQNEKIRYANPAFLKVFGYTEEEILGRPYVNIVAPELRERDMGYHRARIQGRDVPEEYETRILHGNGSLREVLIRGRATEWNGRPANIVIFNDVTRLRQLQEEREKFFRFMVHELRAPLSPLVTTMAVLRNPEILKNPEKLGAIVARMGRSVDRLVSFVDDFLDLSKLDQETLAVRREDVNLEAILREVADGQLPLAEDKGLALAVAPWAPFPVRGDPVVVRTLVQNLVNNAIKYTAAGRVDVRVLRGEDEFSIQVADTGAGLTPEEQKHLFQEFGRIKRMEGVKGTGLGLALVRKLVDACDGRVTVESAGRDKGSCFTITLPMVFGEGR